MVLLYYYYMLILQTILGIQSVADVVRYGRLRWFGHLECRSVDDWVSACRKLCGGVKCRGRKIWRECVNKDMKLLGLQPEWAIFRDMWWKKWTFQNK